MTDEQLQTLAQIRAFLDETVSLDFAVATEVRYGFIVRTVRRFGYPEAPFETAPDRKLLRPAPPKRSKNVLHARIVLTTVKTIDNSENHDVVVELALQQRIPFSRGLVREPYPPHQPPFQIIVQRTKVEGRSCLRACQ